MVREKIDITLSQAIAGFIRECRARGLSIHTISDYTNAYNKLVAWIDDDPDLRSITGDDIRDLLAHLATVPQTPTSAIHRQAKPLSRKSILNIHTGLSALWTWALAEGAADDHIIRNIPRPKPEERAIVPFSRDDIAALLDACRVTRAYVSQGTQTANSRPTNLRDQAIIRTLLDTGVRASELCAITIGDTDLNNQRIVVLGKGAKERALPLGARSTRSIWRYLAADRDKTINVTAPLFAADNGIDTITRRALGMLLQRTGQRAGVSDVHPHRFRHTFAITCLRNGMDVYSLKALLGHSTLDMTMRYLAIVQADVDNAHRKASPVDTWKL